MSNPFREIIEKHEDCLRYDRPVSRNANSWRFKTLKIETEEDDDQQQAQGDEEVRSSSSSTFQPATFAPASTVSSDLAFFKVDPLDRNVQELVDRLRQLIGDFDTSAIDCKVAAIQAGLTSAQLNLHFDLPQPPLSSTGASPLVLRPGSFGTFNNHSLQTPAGAITQARPFMSGTNRSLLLSETPKAMGSATARRQSSRMSIALRSTRYSMGLNIHMDTKPFLQVSPSGLVPDSPSVASPTLLTAETTPRFTSVPPGTPFTSQALHTKKENFFVQFCVVDIEPELITGRKTLNQAHFQPTRSVYQFPENTPPIVDNLHEYCFPHGARLERVKLSQWRLAEGGVQERVQANPMRSKRGSNNDRFGSRYQLLQFTDATNRVYHACCLITTSRLTSPTPILLKQLEEIEKAIIAANTIKHKLKTYVQRKRAWTTTSIAMKWEQNIVRSREPSIDPRFSQPRQARTSKGTGSNGGGGGLKGFIAGLMSRKKKHNDPMAKLQKKTSKGGTWGLLGNKSGSSSTGKVRTLSNISSDSSIENLSIPGTTEVKGGETMAMNGKEKRMSGRRHALNILKRAVDSPKPTNQVSDGLSFRVGFGFSATSPHYSLPSPASSCQDRKSVQSSHSLSDISDDGGESTTDPNSNSGKANHSKVFFASRQDQQHQQQHHQHLPRKEKKVVVAEKAYIFLSDKPLPALFFQILRAIARKDQSRTSHSHRATPKGASTSSRSLQSVSVDRARDDSISSLRSYASLLGLQQGLMKDYLTYLYSLDFAKVINSVSNLKGAMLLSYPGYVDQEALRVPKAVIKLEEWCLAVLCKILPPSVIAQIHSLLLLEQSLAVIGSDPALISLVCTAFLHLLSPFRWAGIFVPVLPPLAQEVLDAPVPYIVGLCLPELFVGTVTQSPSQRLPIASSTSVLYLDDFIHHGSLYNATELSRATNLLEVRASIRELEHLFGDELELPNCRYLEVHTHFNNNDGVAAAATQSDVMLLDSILSPDSPLLNELIGQITYQYERYQARLRRIYPHHLLNSLSTLSSSSTSSSQVVLASTTNSLHRLIRELLSEDDLELFRPIRAILKTFQQFNISFTGGLEENTLAWEKVGSINAASGYLDVDVDRVIAPLRARIAMQEGIVNTQHFTSYADRCFSKYQDLAHVRLFLGEWLTYRILRRKRHRRSVRSRNNSAASTFLPRQIISKDETEEQVNYCKMK
eukprot:gene2487-2725_t